MRIFGWDRGRAERIETLEGFEATVADHTAQMATEKDKAGRLSRYAKGLCRTAEEFTSAEDLLAAE